jgi:hypothetical protein
VKEVVEKEGVKTGKLVTEYDGHEAASETIRVDPDGVSRTHINDTKIEPEVVILKFGFTDEDGWEVQSKVVQSKVIGKFTL